MNAPVRTRRQSGFTLLELMIAMSIFVLIGVALVALVTTAFEFLRVGSSSAETSDAGATFSETFDEDIDSVFATRNRIEGVRFLSYLQKWPVADTDAMGQDVTYDVIVQVFGFVRTIKGEEHDRLYRMMGDQPGAAEYLDGLNDEREGAEGKLRAGGGLMEVLYVAVPDPGQATSTLWRAYRAPIGGENSLLQLDAIPDREALTRICKPLIGGVLHFEVRFWDTSTTDRYGAEPLRIWDSTRGLLDSDDELNPFPHAVGPESTNDTRDDLFPRRLRATLTLTGTGRQAEFARLIAPLDSRSPNLEIDKSGLVPAIVDVDNKFLKVGSEWVQFAGRQDGTGFSGLTRAQRGTPLRDHPAGELVYFGRTFSFDKSVAAFREEYVR